MHRATISETELAALLGWPPVSVKRLVARGEIPSWILEDLDGRPLHAPRIGRRTARRLIRRELDGERARRALAALDEQGPGRREHSGDARAARPEGGALRAPARSNPRLAVDGDQPSAKEGYVLDLKAAARAHPQALSFAAYGRIARASGLAPAARVASAFGGWNAAKEAAGLSVESPRPRDRVPDDRLLEGLREAAAGADSLTIATYDRYARAHGMRTAAAVASRFGSWTAAVERAGLTPRPPGARGHRIDPGDR